MVLSFNCKDTRLPLADKAYKWESLGLQFFPLNISSFVHSVKYNSVYESRILQRSSENYQK